MSSYIYLYLESYRAFYAKKKGRATLLKFLYCNILFDFYDILAKNGKSS